MPLQATSGAASYDAYGGGVPVVPTYIEDVFSTWLYTGTGAALTINNGIDLAGKGGMTWFKGRNTATSHALFDTNRGAGYSIYSNATSAQSYFIDDLSAFNSNGFSLGDSATSGRTNASGYNYVSWTFREQAKFFDIVTYSGTDSAQTISHNLGSTPGMIIVKDTNIGNNWIVYHRSLNGGTNPETRFLVLNTTAAQATSSAIWNNTAPTSTQFTVGAPLSAAGGNYVAYLFAHNAGGFGLTGTDNVISCGSFTTNGSGSATVSLGYEPQYLMFKSTGTQNWFVVDVMRGFSYSATLNLKPNTSAADADFGPNAVTPTATGFVINAALSASQNYIYMAIRRPMKVPTTGTSVFSPNTETTTTTPQTVTTGFTVDLCINTLRDGGFASIPVMDRLRGGTTTSYNFLTTTATDAEATGTGGGLGFDNNIGLVDNAWLTNTNAILWNFRRAPNFFDEVCYTGTGTAGQTYNHNLGVTPELMIVKSRSFSSNWQVYSASTTAAKYLELNTTSGAVTVSTRWNNTEPTSSVFTVGTSGGVNNNGSTYVAYLFASCPGVSKVGSYTGTGSTQTISCGFTGGARFVLIKRTDSTGDWWVWDTARGMVSGTDPRLAMNSTAAEINNNWVYTTTGGFQIVTSDATINASGGSYIFLSIA